MLGSKREVNRLQPNFNGAQTEQTRLPQQAREHFLLVGFCTKPDGASSSVTYFFLRSNFKEAGCQNIPLTSQLT